LALHFDALVLATDLASIGLAVYAAYPPAKFQSFPGQAVMASIHRTFSSPFTVKASNHPKD
jgi:hypothetical protein